MNTQKQNITAPALNHFIAGFFILSLLCTIASCAGVKKSTQHSAGSGSSNQDSIAMTTSQADSIFSKALQEKLAGHYDNAMELFQQFSKARPGNATAHYEMAKIYYLNQNNNEKALQESKRAAQLDPDNKWMQEFYADMLALAQQNDAATAIYQKLSDKEKLSQDYLAKQVMLYMDGEEYDKALESLNQLQGRYNVDEESILLLKNDIFIKQKKYDSAEVIAKRLTAIDPTEPRYWIMLANVYENRQDTVQAKRVLDKVTEEFKDNPKGQSALLEYYLSKDQMPEATEVFRNGMRNKNFAGNDKRVLLAIFNVHSDSDTTTNLAITGEELKYGASQLPVDTYMVKTYAEYLLLMHQPDSAAEQYKRLVHNDTAEKVIWNNILFTYAQQQEADSLIKYGRLALNQFPSDVNYNYLASVGYQLKGNYENTTTLLQAAIKNYKDDSSYIVRLPFLYSGLADAYYFEKQYAASDSANEKALQLEPDNATALNNYSYYLSERGTRLDEAEKMSAKSLTLRPDEATFLDTYGWILYKQGKYKEAKKYIEKAIGQLNDNADGAIYEHLGDIELKLGNKRSAVQAWKKAQSLEGASENISKKIKDNE